MNQSWYCLMVSCGIFATLCIPLAAEDRAVTVLGTGEVMAKPDCLEIEVRAAAAAELTGDAVVKYRDSLRRVRSSITKLGMKNLTIEERSLRVTSGVEQSEDGPVFVVQGQPAAGPKPEVHITRSLRLLVRGIDKLPEGDIVETISKLLDAAKDAGADVGKLPGSNVYENMMVTSSGNSVAHFLVEHPEELREQAYHKAFEAASSRAARLAKLANARLGQVLTIDEVETSQVVHVYGQSHEDGADRLTADGLTEIPVRVSLRVRFSLANNNDENEAAPHAAP